MATTWSDSTADVILAALGSPGGSPGTGGRRGRDHEPRYLRPPARGA